VRAAIELVLPDVPQNSKYRTLIVGLNNKFTTGPEGRVELWKPAA